MLEVIQIMEHQELFLLVVVAVLVELLHLVKKEVPVVPVS